MNTLRAFIAVELPKNITTCLENVQHSMKKYGLDIRWVRPENIHLTLRFLGDITVETRGYIDSAIEATASQITSFKLNVRGLGVFPGIKNARVLWAGLSGEIEMLINLRNLIERELVQVGIKKEKRHFKAHLTLGRIKHKLDPSLLLNAVRACGEFEPESFIVDRIVLFKSDLKPTGAVYTPLFQKGF